MAYKSNARKMELKLNKGFGKVKLGMTRAEVEEAYGAPDKVYDATSYYFDNFMEVEYDKENEAVCFIQINSGGDLAAMYKRKNLFELTDKEILEVFTEHDELYLENSKYGELGYTYTFENLQLNFWRECNPLELEEELKTLDKKDPEQKKLISFYKGEIKQYSHFDTVSVFSKEYYNK